MIAGFSLFLILLGTVRIGICMRIKLLINTSCDIVNSFFFEKIASHLVKVVQFKNNEYTFYSLLY